MKNWRLTIPVINANDDDMILSMWCVLVLVSEAGHAAVELKSIAAVGGNLLGPGR